MLVVSVPNVANITVRLALLFGRFDYTDRGILDRTHLHFYTRRTARAFLEENGWEIVTAKTTVMPLELVLGLDPANPLMRTITAAARRGDRGLSRTAGISVRLSGEAARVTLRLAAPGIFLAGLLLLPFLNKPFTIDDPLFMREAAHALVDPLHPADFEQVWNAGDRQKLSQYLLGGTLPAYVLAPVAALGGREWIAHLYQFLLLCGFLIASVSVARRLGCDRRQANTVGLLVASNPVTLAMAATCMPDVMAMMFGMAGMDRVLALPRAASLGCGLASALLLAAAILCRASTAPLLLVAALLLWPPTWKVRLAAGSRCDRGDAVRQSESRTGGPRYRGCGVPVADFAPQRAAQPGGISLLPGAHRTAPGLRSAFPRREIRRHCRDAGVAGSGPVTVAASANLVLYAVPAAWVSASSWQWRSLPLLVFAALPSALSASLR